MIAISQSEAEASSVVPVNFWTVAAFVILTLVVCAVACWRGRS